MPDNGDLAFDTNVIVDFLKNTRGAIDLAALIDEQDCFVSVITRLELLKYPEITAEEEARILDFLALVPVVPMNEEIENKTIAISRATKLKLPDAIIAATTIVNKAALVTRDKHFIECVYPPLHLWQ